MSFTKWPLVSVLSLVAGDVFVVDRAGHEPSIVQFIDRRVTPWPDDYRAEMRVWLLPDRILHCIKTPTITLVRMKPKSSYDGETRPEREQA